MLRNHAEARRLRLQVERLEREKKELEETVRRLQMGRNEDKEESQEGQDGQVHEITQRGNLVQDNQAKVVEISRSGIGAATGSNSNRITLTKSAGDDLQKAVDKLTSELRKLTEEFDMAKFEKYETDAIVIENEEKRKRDKEELREEMRRLQRDTEERCKQMAERQEADSSTSAALQDRIEEISQKIERLEEKQSENKITKSYIYKHNKIQETLVPLEGKIQLISRQVDKETILVLGGQDNRKDEMVILKQDRWIKLKLKLPKQHYSGGAVYLDGEIYIFGGSYMEKELYKLDNKTLKWIRLADMNEERRYISNSSVEWNGSISVFGGEDKRSYLKSVERYDPKKNKWIKMPEMKYSRYHAAAAVHNGKFIVCGGWDGLNRLTSVECFDPESGVWTEMNDMPTPLSGHSLVSYGNNLIVMGGVDGKTQVNTVLELSNLEKKGTWKELPPMKQPRHSFTASVLDNEIFVIVGLNRTLLDKTEIFNGKSWREGPLLPNACFHVSSIVIPQHFADILCNF